MNTDEITSKVKDFFNKSAKVSKEAFEKAGDKVQEFSDKSVVRLEKKQLENKMQEKYTEAGKKVVELLQAGNNINFGSEENDNAVKAILEEINALSAEIAQKEELLK